MDSTALSGHAQWLSLSDGPIYTVLHTPDPAVTCQSTAVLFVSPFGWDDILSYRARRYWAIKLAEAGHVVLRMDPPGAGESYGDGHQSELPARWASAVTEAARWLRASSGATRVAAIGLGMGGLMACQALADGAPIDDLLLWAVKGKGRAAVREAVAYAGVVASDHPEDQAGPQPGDGVDVTGYLLSEATMAALSATDVGKLEFPEPERRRVLLLSRDDLGVDEHLQRSLTAAGLAVTTTEVADYKDLMNHPQTVDARRPGATIALSTAWLRDGSAGVGADPAPVSSDAVATDSVRMPWGDGFIRETIINAEFDGNPGTLVVSGPEDSTTAAPIGVLLLNSGTIRKTGPHRMWVEIARRWAARGIVCARADLGPVGDSVGIGDSGADERPVVSNVALTAPPMQQAVADAITQLRQHGPAEHIAIVGHCSGAYLGFRAALDDEAVDAVYGINLQAFVFDDGLHQERMFERIVSVARGGIVKRLREQGLTAHEVRQVMDAVKHRYGRGRRESSEEAAHREGLIFLDQLRDRDVELLLLFSQEEPLHEDLFSDGFQAQVAYDRWPNAAIEELPTKDHMIRAIWIQKLTMARLEVALDETLSRCADVDRQPSALSS